MTAPAPEPVEVFAGSSIDAELVRSALEAAGIESAVINEAMGTLAPFALGSGGLGAVRIVVAEADAPQAREVLAAAGQGGPGA
jgi:hypothetical protein